MALGNPFNSVMGMFSRDIGIDLGTANTSGGQCMMRQLRRARARRT